MKCSINLTKDVHDLYNANRMLWRKIKENMDITMVTDYKNQYTSKAILITIGSYFYKN
jgi:hypothetical protein